MLQPFEGTHGIAFEDFRDAIAGKIKPVEGGKFILMPAAPKLVLVV